MKQYNDVDSTTEKEQKNKKSLLHAMKRKGPRGSGQGWGGEEPRRAQERKMSSESSHVPVVARTLVVCAARRRWVPRQLLLTTLPTIMPITVMGGCREWVL